MNKMATRGAAVEISQRGAKIFLGESIKFQPTIPNSKLELFDTKHG